MKLVSRITAEMKAYPFPMTPMLDTTEAKAAKEESTGRTQRTMIVKWADNHSRDPHAADLVEFAILNVLEDLVGKAGTVFKVGECTYGLVLYGTQNELTDEAMEQLETFLGSCLDKYAKVQVRIGIGSLMHTFLDLNKSLAFALDKVKDAGRTEELESHPFVEEAKVILQNNFGDGVCLKVIAKQLFVNSAYLGRLFKSYEAVTFNDYLIQVRMEKAKELLKTTDKKIYEIAHEVGYRQLDWFYKRFREYTGYSAKEFKGKAL
jgi:AraC-like DNA-binding protein